MVGWAGNLERMEELVHVATALHASLRDASKPGSGDAGTLLYHVNDFLFKHALHHINMFRLVRYHILLRSEFHR